MKSLLTICFLLLIGNGLLSQDLQAIQDEIDAQIWEPFKEAYEARDAEAFFSIHAPEIMRITMSGIRVGEEYRETITQSFARPDQAPRTIEFRFEQRLVKDSVAYEVGMYQLVVQDDSHAVYFGRFHVVLKKENGQWLIHQDYDTSIISGEPVDEEDWMALE